jgi:CRISPR-associated endonuclease/helicase Cas3
MSHSSGTIPIHDDRWRMSEEYWAHNRGGLPHQLDDHLTEVARRAAQHAGHFGAAWAHLAGLWHDLGKYRPGFQTYIRLDPDAHIEGKLPARSDKSHAAAGALHAIATLRQHFGRQGEIAARLLAYVIAGHHAGLADWVTGLGTRLLGTGATASGREYDEALRACEAAAPHLLSLPRDFDLGPALLATPGVRGNNPLAWSLWVRMLFSALVDADFLDTEAFMNAGRADARDAFAPLAQYRERLDDHLARLAQCVAADGRGADPVMHQRADVLRRCREQAQRPPGVFSLEVPTGGGKTLSSLAFALEHAVQHGKRRVVYAIPYTSIIEQTADVFSSIFGRDAVVEHHSQADAPKDAADDAQDTAATRLACENWAAPLVVTTNVQLFESLFAARTSRCRKLHNLAGSVIVLDEAQLLPPEFLQPILDTLRLLVDHYGVTLLLCTATQPVLTDAPRFDPLRSLRGLAVPQAIVEQRDALFDALDRVAIDWPADLQQPVELPALAERIAGEDGALAVVNTRRDAAELLAALDAATGERALHLSAAMCGQHRADTIAEVRARLAARRAGTDTRALRVVSTQLVEAGVDIDFPVVYRALAGLDSIAQAAGRCNREGLLPGKGRVEVFVRDIPKPLSALRAGVQATRSTLGQERPAALQPAHFEAYFRHYYDGFASRDARGIVDLLRCDDRFAMSFRTAADKFRLIDDKEQVSLIVPYQSPNPDARDIAPLIERLRAGKTDRWLLRALQRHIVQVRRSAIAAWQQRGDADEVQPGLFILRDVSRYDDRRGLIGDEDPRQPVLVA